MTLLYLFITAFGSYLIGSFPTAYLVVKQFAHKNILEEGTGNVGTMNTHRATNNKWLTAMVFLGDHLKGILAYLLAVYFAQKLDDQFLSATLIGLSFFFVILGHNYSLWLNLKGGKGLATAAGFFLLFNPWMYVIWVVSFFIIAALSKYMVLAQLMATIVITIVAFIFFSSQFWIILFPALLVIIKHAPRIKDVISGKEPTFYVSEDRKEYQRKQVIK